jgi:D-2-hydroxyacid dehydrogenase (NADP+)
LKTIAFLPIHSFMNIILLQGELSPQQIELLLKEFPHYLFLSLTEAAAQHLSVDHWERLEILYGTRLTKENLAQAPQLRWIHCPSSLLNKLCMDEIEKQGNILVTNTTDENIFQMGEFFMSGILAFAKNLFKWKEAAQHPPSVWDSKWRDTMWTLRDKLLLQIGTGRIGTEIARRARQMGMRVWGVQHGSFNPYCQKVFSFKDLPSILPLADVVSMSPARGKESREGFKIEPLLDMKEDAILVLTGSMTPANEHALAHLALNKKLRGILVDAFYQTPIPVTSPLWEISSLIITPEVASRPKNKEQEAFRTFLYNLRQYQHGNFEDMRNLVEKRRIL